MVFSERDSFITSLKSIAIIGTIIVLHHLLLAFQKAFKADRITRASLKSAIHSQLNIESTKYDVIGGALIILISMLCSSITSFDYTLILLSASHFLLLFKKKDVEPAIGLAWSYYFGYLRIILPKYKNNCSKSKLRDHLIPKLFVLIPSDCKVYDQLNNADDRLEFAENLGAVNEDVAGVRVRRYVNTLYRVRVNNEMFYAAIEYATPLKTLRSMADHKETGFSKQERHHQTLLFYDTIKNIINNHSDPPEIKDRVDFIFLEHGMSIADEICKRLLSS